MIDLAPLARIDWQGALILCLWTFCLTAGVISLWLIAYRVVGDVVRWLAGKLKGSRRDPLRGNRYRPGKWNGE